MLLSVLVIGSQSPSLKSDPLYNVLTFLQFSHTNPHGGEVGEMHTKSQWRALRIALQREADVILYSSGETVLIESGSTVAMMRSR